MTCSCQIKSIILILLGYENWYTITNSGMEENNGQTGLQKGF